MDHEAREESVLEDSFRQIGADLNSARLSNGMQINELSQLLRISRHYLKNLESGDFDALPGPTYVAGYLRSFAQEVGLDAADISQRYRALLGDDEKGPAYSFPVDTQRPQRSGAMLASIVVIFAVAGYGGWYALGKPDILTALTGQTPPETVAMKQIESTVTEPDDMSNPDIGPVVPVTSDATVTPASGSMTGAGDTATTLADAPSGMPTQESIPAVIDTVENAPLGEAVPPPDSDTGSDVDLAATPPLQAVDPSIPAVQMSGDTMPAAGTLADSTSIAAVTPPASASAQDTAGLATSDGTGEAASAAMPADVLTDDRMVAAAPDPADTADSLSGQLGTGVAFARQRLPEMEITLRAIGASWVEIIRNDGEEVMTKLMRAGDTYLVDSRDRLYLSTGNAGGLELVFNDGTTRSIGDSGEILRDLLLDATKLRNQF